MVLYRTKNASIQQSKQNEINKMKRQHVDWEKIFVNLMSEKSLVSKYTRNLHNSTAKNK
jgi:hypothetical protein